MDEQDPRFRRIIREAQMMFLQDTEQRLMAIREAVADYEQGTRTKDELSDAVYRHVHAMKGVALTLYFDTFHVVCEEINGRLHKEAHSELEADAIIAMTECLYEAFADCPGKVLAG